MIRAESNHPTRHLSPITGELEELERTEAVSAACQELLRNDEWPSKPDLGSMVRRTQRITRLQLSDSLMAFNLKDLVAAIALEGLNYILF
ncbi:hypothetical protein ACLOJK_026837 [Asimina triloba]